MEEVIRSIAEMIRQRFNPLKIILYGSYARGTQTWDSDVDFLVVVGKK
ncbi:MAG: nucleotidyltransferase domain-containing protein [Acetomicrobium sp.]